MTVELPKSIADGHSSEWTALHLAIGLYVSKEATLGQAAEAAGLSQLEFQNELGKRKIPINHTIDDLAADIETMRALTPLDF